MAGPLTHGAATRVREMSKNWPPWLDELSELDLLLATWEWRDRQTPGSPCARAPRPTL